MKKVRVNLVIFFVVAALVALLIVQFIQTVQLYDRKSAQFTSKVNTALERIAVRHEKAEDIRRYLQVVNRDFTGHYRDILKEEFQNLLAPQESISVQDTTVYENGENKHYLLIKGTAYDSISGVQTEQKVLARDVRHVDELLVPQHVNPDSITFSVRLNQRVMQKLFKKARFVNEMIVDAFRSNIYEDPAQRIDIAFLDSVIRTEMKHDNLPADYRFLVTDEFGNPVQFAFTPADYDPKLDYSRARKTQLFPANTLDDALYLHVFFPNRRTILLREMWIPFVISLLLVILIVAALIFMFRTILTQKKLFELKNDFISNMTHEFKTPISTISLACQAMKDSDMVGGQVDPKDPFVNMIVNENKRLEKLVEQILQSAVLERGEQQVNYEHVILNEVVYNLAEDTRFRIKSLNGTVETLLPDEIYEVTTDSLHLTNVLNNLLDNAVKYSRGTPDIRIELKKAGKNYSISIRDRGIGMKKDQITRIFDKLYRIPTGNVHDVKGFGLGLSYVKAMCELHNWDIHVRSTFGEGSEFTLTINSKV